MALVLDWDVPPDAWRDQLKRLDDQQREELPRAIAAHARRARDEGIVPLGQKITLDGLVIDEILGDEP
jgi:hypothetical protein